MQGYCTLRNSHDKVRDGRTPYELRHGQPFGGKTLQFGCGINYKPSSTTEVWLIQKFGPKTRPGIFIGYHMHNGGLWSGDYLVVDAEAFTSTPSSRTAYVHRVKEITHHGEVKFPVKDGTLKQPDPVDHDRHVTEANAVFGKEEDDLARLPRDLTFGTDVVDPAAGDRERAT